MKTRRSYKINLAVLDFLTAMSVVESRLRFLDLAEVLSEEGNSTADFISAYLYAFQSGEQQHTMFLQEHYAAIKKFAESFNRSYFNIEEYVPIIVPKLFVFWETDAINRRVDKRYNYVPTISLTKWHKAEYKLSLLDDIHYFGVIEKEYWERVNARDIEFNDRHEGVLSMLQLTYLRNVRGNKYKLERESNITPTLHQMWKGVLENVSMIPLTIDSSKLSLYNNFLRQAKGYEDLEYDVMNLQSINEWNTEKEQLEQAV
jgi:hypothetical protein